MEGYRRILEAVVEELVRGLLHDVADGVFSVVLRQGVGFVHEYGIFDLGVELGQVKDGVCDPANGLHVTVLSIDDPDDAAHAGKDGFRVETAVQDGTEMAIYFIRTIMFTRTKHFIHYQNYNTESRTCSAVIAELLEDVILRYGLCGD
ncbi:MAG: hypothetical protein Q9184_007014 [Pyrenodesmia sp. 2 TL-2023]